MAELIDNAVGLNPIDPGPAVVVVEAARLATRIEPVRLKNSALAATPNQDSPVWAASELIGSPGFSPLPGPGLVLLCFTRGAECPRHLSHHSRARGRADGEKGLDRLIGPGFPGLAIQLQLLLGFRLIAFQATAQLSGIGLQFSDQGLQPVITQRLTELKAADQAAHLGGIAGAECNSELTGPQAALLAQQLEMAREMGTSPNRG